MKIAIIAPINHPIKAPFQGGLEAHSWWLAKKLLERGHDVKIFASGDSDPSLPLVSIRQKSLFSDKIYRLTDGKSFKNKMFRTLRNFVSDRSYAKATKYIAGHKFDVVHINALAAKPLKDAGRYQSPVVTVLHTPIFREILAGVKAAGKNSHYIAVSEYLADSWSGFAKATVIHNGIKGDEWSFRDTAVAKTAIWFGRINSAKAPHLAIQTAIQAGYHLDLYGGIEDQAYFDREVAPLLKHEDIIYHGLADHEVLNKKIGEASVMICTPLWDEPFGFIYIEALACGTPVASFKSGAVAEIINDKTGVIVDKGDVEALAKNLNKASSLSRQDCRAAFESNFDIDRMVENYEAYYSQIVRTQ